MVCLPLTLAFSVMNGLPTYFSGQLILLTSPIHRIPDQFINKSETFSYQK